MALATRALMDDLRSAGQITRGPKLFQPRDYHVSVTGSSLDLSHLVARATAPTLCTKFGAR
jgi:hypothetical protein